MFIYKKPFQLFHSPIKGLRLSSLFFLLFVISFVPSQAVSKTAIEVFQLASQSVVIVYNYDAAGVAQLQGSGVILPSRDVATNCHVIKDAARLTISYLGKEYQATIRYTDLERDICSLEVKGLDAQSVIMGSTSHLQVGARVYAIGAPKGLELSLSEGIVASLRELEGGHVIQTTAPISPGSSGGGLFDDEGRLIGLPTFYFTEAQQVNFAIPVEWVFDLPKRHSVLVAKSQDEIISTRSKAEQGDAEAQQSLGWMYYKGQGVTQNYAEALKWYKLSANQGFARAQLSLGVMYTLGLGVPLNNEEALKWYNLAANQGLAPAQSLLGSMYADGLGVAQNYAEAVKWYRLAAIQGYDDAQNDLGLKYENGQGVEQNEFEAVKWYKLAADQGNAHAQYNLARAYSYGKGVTQNDTDAFTWYLLSAKQGDADAQASVGWRYSTGKGCAQNYNEAVKWYQLAADQGNAFSQNSLGVMYEYGTGVVQNYKEAVKWYRLSAEQGNALAQTHLARAYSNGNGVVEDYSVSLKWYRLAADQGNRDAMYAIGWIFYSGNGVAQSNSEALKWFLLAANQGNADAQNALGVMYENGIAVSQSYTVAVKWYRLAANQGDALGEYHLGLMYENGKGLTKDFTEALKWIQLSAAQGLEDAKTKLNEIQNQPKEERVVSSSVADGQEKSKFLKAAEPRMHLYPDFKKVVYAKDLSISKDMIRLISRKTLAADIAYYFGKHKAESKAVSLMSYSNAALEIDKIEKRLKILLRKNRSENPPQPKIQITIDQYKEIVASVIKQHWEFSKAQLASSGGMAVYVRINILPNGSINLIAFDKRASSEYLNITVRKAIEKSSPLPAIPSSLGVKDLWLRFVFTPEGIK